MNELDSLKEHHELFVTLVDEINLLLRNEDIDSVAEKVMGIISELNGHLMVHLTVEDRHVYPVLMASNNFAVRDKANKFKSEIGGLFVSFQDYRLKWSSVKQVIEDPQNFTRDTEKIFSFLNKRMALEDEFLYPEVISSQVT